MGALFVGELQGTLYALMALSLAMVLQMAINQFYRGRFDPVASIERGNLAAALRYGGLHLGLFLALVGFFSDHSRQSSFMGDVVGLYVYGAVTIVFLLVSLYLNDVCILDTVDNNKAIQQGNVPIGIVEAGTCIGTGLIAAGSMTGSGGIGTAIVFFALGQFVMLASTRVYEWITPGMQLRHASETGNTAAAVHLASILVSLAIILRSVIAGDFHGWAVDLMGFATGAVIGFIVLYVVEILVDRWILTTTTVTELVQENRISAIVFLSAIRIGAALVIASVVV